MARRVRAKGEAAKEIVDGLFAIPPVNEAELKSRLGRVETHDLRRLLLERLERGAIPMQQGMLLVSALGQVGLGELQARMTGIALDRTRGDHERLWAIMALSGDDPALMRTVARQISPPEMAALAEASLSHLLMAGESEEVGRIVGDALAELPDDGSREILLERFDATREGLGITAAAAYGPALANAALESLRGTMLARVVTEAREDGASLLETLRGRAASEGERRALMAALLKLRSRTIDPEVGVAPVRGSASVTACDRQGTFDVVGTFENADGTVTIASLSLRAGGDVRDGFLAPRQAVQRTTPESGAPDEGEGGGLAAVTLADAAGLVSQAAQRTRELGKELPEGAQQARARFLEAERGPLTPPASKGGSLEASAEDVAALLDRPEYRESWFFDAGDLAGAGVSVPRRRSATPRWIEKAAARLDQEPVRARLAAMTRHMARWHAWRGEARESRTCLWLEATVEREFRASPLARAMLERAPALINISADPCVEYGNPCDRQELKRVFFSDVKRPTGRELARLDFSEVALTGLATAFDTLTMAEKRPREDERLAAAFDIGSRFADAVIDCSGRVGALLADEPLFRGMTLAVARACGLEERDCRMVSLSVLRTFTIFVAEVCATCPVRCLALPESDARREFFEPTHPSSRPD
jgi:hypothetical protein